MSHNILLKELEEFKVTKMSKLHMNPMIFPLPGLDFEPILFELLQAFFGLWQLKFLHKLIPAKHMSVDSLIAA